METLKINDLNNNSISEKEIVKRIISGEKELFEILLRRNNQKLYRIIRSYLKDEAEVEDIMQNTHLKAYEKLYQFKQNSTYSTWLIRIGINEALARLKEKGKIYNINNGSYNFERNSILEIPDKEQLNPEKIMIRAESKVLVERIIDSLNLKYKTVYILREVEEMPIKEISDCLNISVSNVKVRIHRAKLLLKEKLYEHTKNKDIFEFGFQRCDQITTKVMKKINSKI